MKDEFGTLHAGQILALRTICSFLLAREMKRESGKLTELHEAFIQTISEAIQGVAPDDAVAQEIEAASSHELDLIFRTASGMSDSMQR